MQGRAEMGKGINFIVLMYTEVYRHWVVNYASQNMSLQLMVTKQEGQVALNIGILHIGIC